MEQLLNEIWSLTAQALEYAESIFKITDEIKEHIHNKDIDSLEKALRMRQKKITEVDAVNKAAKEKTDELFRVYSLRSFEEIDSEKHPMAKRILGLREKTKLIYEKTIEIDKINFENAENLLTEYKDEIKEFHARKNAIQAYGGKKVNQSILIDDFK